MLTSSGQATVDLPPHIGTPAVIQVRGLTKRYGSYLALDGIDLEVRPGQIFALLGPNGAGKTTALEILEGYRHRDAGTVSVLGVDPARATLAWRARIGLVLQDSQMPAELTVTDMVERYAGYFPHPRGVAATIDLVGLTDKRDTRSGRLSGGQLRRLDVAMALIGDPDLVFLDEPTTGFDPAARRSAWSMIENLRQLGKTVLLTTHYMDEAEELADYIAILVAGRVAATGTPATIGGRDHAPIRISFHLPPGVDIPTLHDATAQRDGDDAVIMAADATETVGHLIDWARQQHVDLAGLNVHGPSLEDIYLDLAVTSS